jgi:hypothetical protein
VAATTRLFSSSIFAHNIEIGSRLVKLSQGRAIAAGLAIALLALGVPQTLDSVLRLYSGLPEVFAGTADIHPGPEAAATETLLKDADDWTGDPSARIGAGILERRLAFRGNGQAAVADLTLARQDIENGLARAPANALAWAELAAAELGLDDPVQAKAAWRTSILLASYEPSLNLWRAQIGFQLWLGLVADDRELLNEQIDFSWDQNSRQLVGMAKNDPVLAQIIRGALAQDPERLSAYDRAIAKRP